MFHFKFHLRLGRPTLIRDIIVRKTAWRFSISAELKASGAHGESEDSHRGLRRLVQNLIRCADSEKLSRKNDINKCVGHKKLEASWKSDWKRRREISTLLVCVLTPFTVRISQTCQRLCRCQVRVPILSVLSAESTMTRTAQDVLISI